MHHPDQHKPQNPRCSALALWLCCAALLCLSCRTTGAPSPHDEAPHGRHITTDAARSRCVQKKLRSVLAQSRAKAAKVRLKAAALLGALVTRKPQRFHCAHRRFVWLAVRWLGPGGQNKAHKRLHALAQDPAWKVRKAAIHSLGQLDSKRVLPPLLQAAKDRHPQVRLHALLSLRLHKSPKKLSLLLTACKDPQEAMRREAARALGETGRRAALAPLLQMLQDKAPKVRQAAVKALSKLGDQRAFGPLCALLRRDNSARVRLQALLAVQHLGGKRAVAPMLLALQDPSKRIRATTLVLLSQTGDRRAEKPLYKALQDENPTIRLVVASALWNWHKGAIVPLVGALQDPVREVRHAVALSLARLGDPRANNILRRILLTHKSDITRITAIHALSQVEGPEAHRILRKALRDKHPHVRKVARQALRLRKRLQRTQRKR